MVVIVLSNCPPKLRGDISKWLFEVDTGVYVGNPTTRVRDKLWERVKTTIEDGQASMVYSAHCEQGLKFEVYRSKKTPIDFDGIQLMLHPKSEKT